jgi:alkanesulfonate monooxygenase SsuD/methylene tetrahydromethanopterin reductase-like flavin-dependent oxidoreductase (luciferase family)
MKYGVVLPIWRLTTAEAERMTLRAEELGWDGVFVPDHIMAKPATTEHYGPSWPDPFSLLGLPRRADAPDPGGRKRDRAAVSQSARRREGRGHGRPGLGGRFIFGIGVGWDEAEFKDLGLPFSERGAMADEYLAIIKAAWSADEPSYAAAISRSAGRRSRRARPRSRIHRCGRAARPARSPLRPCDGPPSTAMPGIRSASAGSTSSRAWRR